MKLGRFSALLAAFAFAAVSCNTEEEQTAPAGNISVDAQEVAFDMTGSTKEIAITSDSYWKATVPPDAGWLVVAPMRGTGNTAVKLIAVDNTEFDPREVTLTFSVDGKSLEVKVSQEGDPVIFKVTGPSETLPAEGGTLALKVECNESYSCTSLPEWIQPQTKAGTKTDDLAFTVGENTMVDSRTGNIEFTSKSGRVRNFTVKQFGSKPDPVPYKYPDFVRSFKSLVNVFTGSNGAVADWKLVFKEVEKFSHAGTVIERVGGNDSNKKMGSNTGASGNTYFTTIGWNVPGGAIIYDLPLIEDVSGEVEFGFSFSSGAHYASFKSFEVFWSTDKTNWKPVDGLHAIDDASVLSSNSFKIAYTDIQNRQVAEINVTETLKAGTHFYVKVQLADVDTSLDPTKTLRMNVGCTLSQKTPDTDFSSDPNVIVGENFSYCKCGPNLVMGEPVYYFISLPSGKPSTEIKNGFTKTGDGIAHRDGFIGFNNTGGLCYVTTPALESLDKPTDVMLTFKACLFMGSGTDFKKFPNTIGVSLTGSGTLEEFIWDTDPASDYFNWHVGHVMVRGANSDTKLNIGNVEGSADGAHFYLDEIVVSR